MFLMVAISVKVSVFLSPYLLREGHKQAPHYYYLTFSIKNKNE